MKYTTIIPVKSSDYFMVEPVCNALNDKYEIGDIFIITKTDSLDKTIDIPNVTTVDEDKLYPGLSFSAVKDLMKSTDYLDSKFTGHCFQQLLKMAFCFFCKTDGYLVWDADTFPLRQIDFFDAETGKTTFHMKSEYDEDYFINLKRILDVDKQVEKSFISEHMYFECSVMKEIIEKINLRDNPGDNWWEKVVLAMPCGNGVSEYEIYGNYMLANYPDRCILKDANSLRYGMNVLGKKLTREKLDWVGRNYDCVSFENWDRETFLTGLSNARFVKHINSRFYASVISYANRGINHFRRK